MRICANKPVCKTCRCEYCKCFLFCKTTISSIVCSFEFATDYLEHERIKIVVCKFSQMLNDTKIYEYGIREHKNPE